jgi:dihydrofolate reductase
VKKHPKIIARVATSVDGFIARPDGSYDWLDRPRPLGNYGMNDFFRSIDTIIWGKKTYDQAVARFEGKSLGFGPKVKNYVFAHDPPQSAPSSVEFVTEPVEEFAPRLRAQPGKDIWIMGGGQIIASFLDAGQIDEIRISVIPILIGEAFRCFTLASLVHLKLRSVKRFSDGVVHLVYRTSKQSQG